MTRDSISSARPDTQEDSRPRDEAELVARVLQGERSAFAPLVAMYEPTVYAICRRWLHGNAAEAEDLSQETFLRAFSRLGELKDRRRFGPWILMIARSLCRERVRRLKVERRALEGRVERERWDAVRDEADDDIQGILRGLPDDERRALELRYFDGLPYREVASRMGLSFARVDHLLRQARDRLTHRTRVLKVQRERSV